MWRLETLLANAGGSSITTSYIVSCSFKKGITSEVISDERLNEMALRRIISGGILFTFSCSQVVDRQLFYDTIVAAAIEAKRNVRVLQQLTQGADHPINIFHPEGNYLKGLVLYVE